jgi:N-methylhydantoinase B
MIVERADYAPDSAGTGRHRGGPGIDLVVSARRDMELTIVNERSQVPPFALAGGERGRRNQALVHHPDGSAVEHAKVTGVAVPKGTRIEVRTGGGAGFGPPEERPAEAVHADVAAGYLTDEGARREYPHAYGA